MSPSPAVLPSELRPPATPGRDRLVQDGPARPLHPGLSTQVRADGALQLGLDPVHGVVLTGLADGETGPVSRLLRILAGASAPVAPAALASASGVPEPRVVDVVRVLDDAGLMVRDRPTTGGGELSAWSLSRRRHGPEDGDPTGGPLPLRDRRAGARVVVDGRGRLVADVARLLGAAEVGAVRHGWYAGSGNELDSHTPDPTLVITVGTRLPRLRAMDWLSRAIPHLPVLARPGSVDIGPLVIPGAGPCLRCIRLHEGTALLADLGREDLLTDAQDDPVRVEPTLGAVAAGTVAMLTLGLLDAYPPPLGVRWHTALPLPSVATSRWSVHPGCDAPSHRTPLGAPGQRPGGRQSVEQGGTLRS